jgi:hypothetical protein
VRHNAAKRRQLKIIEQISDWFATPVLTRQRIWFAFAVAVIIDSIQLSLLFAGWFVVDQVLDVVAFVLTTAAIGFHMLLLPTFVIEFLPVTDMLPTWTGCTAAVVLLRKKAQTEAVPPIIPARPPIDVASEVTRMPPNLPPK